MTRQFFSIQDSQLFLTENFHPIDNSVINILEMIRGANAKDHFYVSYPSNCIIYLTKFILL